MIDGNFRDKRIFNNAEISGIPVQLILLDSVDSTNNYAKELYSNELYTPNLVQDEMEDESATPIVIIAREQTGGRGRYGRSFSSPRGGGLYLTYSFKPEFSLDDTANATPLVANAVHRALSKFTDSPLEIKWVNDIFKDNLKICGVLVEGIGYIDPVTGNFDRMIIGIGVNVLPGDMPEELRGIAGFLLAEEGRGEEDSLSAPAAIAPISKDIGEERGKEDSLSAPVVYDVATAIVSELLTTFYGKKVVDSEMELEYYREHSMLIGRDVVLRRPNGAIKEGKVLGISEDYELIVNCRGKVLHISDGEASARL